MKQIFLNGAWSLEIPGSGFGLVPAIVPGSVYHDLLTAGLIQDPFYRDNETDALKLMEHEFRYSRVMCVDAELLSCDAVILRCEGLDTLAAIYINDTVVGCTDNMHRTWEFNVKPMLRIGENSIVVHFASPTRYIRESYAESPADGSSDAMRGFPNLRKSHCMFGWDWGPRLPDAGIWRDISLIGINSARIRDVLVEQFHHDGTVTLRLHTHVTHLSNAPTEVCASVIAPNGEIWTAQGECCEIVVERPELWWPAGYGAQPLYQVDVELFSGGDSLDHWNKRIGLRTMTVTRKKDEGRETFCHCVGFL